jgi:hypothetical protein
MLGTAKSGHLGAQDDKYVLLGPMVEDLPPPSTFLGWL